MTSWWRPGFHFTPARYWINDPNGLVRLGAVYHLFFQHNPYGDRWGSMSWGHAVSPDLVRWTELPVAMPGSPQEAIYSGSAVEHPAGGLLATYTSVDPSGRQVQALARSVDGGRSWTLDSGNPVLTDPDPQFRDPKLIRTADGWLLLLALAEQRRVRFYTSPDLRSWTPVGEFGPAGSTTGVWEMPDLLRLPVDGSSRTRDVLVVGVLTGGPAGGSGTQYFLGSFDGSTFAAEGTGWVDLGPDFYAAASFSGLGERTVWMAWMSNWRYAETVPTAPWRGALTVPREPALRTVGGTVRLVQRPVPELARLRAAPVAVPAGELAGEVVLPVRGDRLEIAAEFSVGPRGEAGFVVRRSADGREGTRVGWSDGRLVLDRRTSGTVEFHPDFAGAHPAPLPAPDGRVRLLLLVDRCSVEVFGGAGEVALTAQVFPSAGSDRVAAYGRDARLESLTVWPLTAP